MTLRSTVRIHGIAAGGDGVGRLPDGRVVFVPRSAPGDLAELTPPRFEKRLARAEIARLVESSPDRATPPCAHYVEDECGGCAIQHVAYAAQVRAKSTIVRDALRRLGGIEVDDVPIVENPRPLGWRSRVTLAVNARTGAVGLRRRDDPDRVFPLVRCEIASPALQRTRDALRPFDGRLPPRTERITLREARDGGVHVVAHGAAAWPDAADVARACDRADVRATVWVAPEDGDARVVAGVPTSEQATVFEQVDRAMGDAVRAHALESLGDVRGLRVWDLYAGAGDTTDTLAARGALVESVEADAAAVEQARSRAVAKSPPHPVVHAGRVEDLLPTLTAAAAAIVNPPRAGVGRAVVDELLRRAPGRIVYVSCDPATLARDLRGLAERYRVASVRAFDSFPQTAHVETVVSLSTKSR